MRKITSLMLMLLCAVTAWAGPTDLPKITTDLNNPIYYTISNTRSEGKVIYYTAEGVKDENPQVLTDAHKFFFTGSSLSDVKIHNAEAEKSKLLFTGAGKWDAKGVSCEICVTPHGDKTTGLAIKFNDTSLNEQNQGRNGYTTWSADDAGSIFVMDLIENINWPEVGKLYTIEAPLFENVQQINKGLVVNADGSLGWNTIDLTNKNCYWTVEYNSENDGYAVKNHGTGAYLNGTTMSETVANYAKFKYLSQCQFNIVVNGTTVHANGHGNGGAASGNIVSWDGGVDGASAWKFTPIEKTVPFEYANSYDNIDSWYYLKNKGEFYLSHVAEQDYIELGANQKSVNKENEAAFSWGFIGDPINGFKIVNKATGEDYILSSSTATDDGNTGANTYPVMIAASNLSKENNELWVISKSKYQPGGFYIAQKGHNNNRLNNRDNKLAYWTGGADNGSTFQVELSDYSKELNAAIAEAQAVVESSKGDGKSVGYIASEWVTVVDEAIAAKDLATIQAALINIKIIQPEEGKFYTIANCHTDHRGGQQIYVNNDGGMQFAKPEHLSANAFGSIGIVFQFVPAGNNKFYLYNVQRGTYLSTVQGHGWGQNFALATENPSVMVTLAHTGTANIVYITPENSEMVGAMLHAQDSGSAVVGWDANGANDASAWVISEVADITALSHELTVGDAGYSTLCLGYNATIPAGVEAYVVSSIESGYVIMDKVEGVLPANTAVIVKADAGTYNFKYATGEVTAIENNELKGTTVNKNFTDAAYVLGVVENEVGLYTAGYNVNTNTENDDPEVTYEAWKNNAFKAYLPKAVNSNSASLRFDFGTTAIEEVETENAEAEVIYDLCGRRVNQITKAGVYIIGGRKVLVK